MAYRGNFPISWEKLVLFSREWENGNFKSSVGISCILEKIVQRNDRTRNKGKNDKKISINYKDL